MHRSPSLHRFRLSSGPINRSNAVHALNDQFGPAALLFEFYFVLFLPLSLSFFPPFPPLRGVHSDLFFPPPLPFPLSLFIAFFPPVSIVARARLVLLVRPQTRVSCTRKIERNGHTESSLVRINSDSKRHEAIVYYAFIFPPPFPVSNILRNSGERKRESGRRSNIKSNVTCSLEGFVYIKFILEKRSMETLSIPSKEQNLVAYYRTRFNPIHPIHAATELTGVTGLFNSTTSSSTHVLDYLRSSIFS